MVRTSTREYLIKRKLCNFRLHPDLINKLDKMADNHNWSKSKVIEELIDQADINRRLWD